MDASLGVDHVIPISILSGKLPDVINLRAPALPIAKAGLIG